MIDHTGVQVSDYVASRAFYSQALAAIGYSVLMELSAAVTKSADVAGFGAAPKPDFWIASGKPNVPPLHVAFSVDSRAQVDAFYKAAIAAGGRDNGGPGIRPHYHENYYAAFVLDPDSHNIEVVCHKPA